MDYTEATQLLEELFAANGGEFKKENKGRLPVWYFFFLLWACGAPYIFYLCVYLWGHIESSP